MLELTRKYVFHIPLCRYGDGMHPIDIDEILDDLICRFADDGFDSFYVSEVKSHYRSRSFDGLLLTLFCDDDSPEMIFRDWFLKNNAVLGQEALAFERDGKMIIEKLDG